MWIRVGVSDVALSRVRYDRCLFSEASSGTPLGANLPTVSADMMETTQRRPTKPPLTLRLSVSVFFFFFGYVGFSIVSRVSVTALDAGIEFPSLTN